MKVLITTCPAYRKLVPLCLKCFWHVWPDCPWPVEVLGATGPDKGWATNFRRWVAAGNTEPILLLLDDYFLTRVNRDAMYAAAHRAETEADMVRVAACPGPTLPHLHSRLGTFDKHLPYAVSLQAAFWKPKALADLIEPGWNPWQVEIEGSKRAAASPFLFIGTTGYVIEYMNAAGRGRLNMDAIRYAEELPWN
jgi:hypothetical protein